MFPLLFFQLYAAISPAHPVRNAVCILAGWAFILILAQSAWNLFKDAMDRATQMHQIPCANCQFFTENYCLKCAVHPDSALTEAAINCPDYQRKTLWTASPASQGRPVGKAIAK